MSSMLFQSVDTVVDDASSGDDSTESVYERYQDVGCSARRPVILEGAVGQFGKGHHVSTSSTSSNATLTGCRSWKEAELMHLDGPLLQGVTQDEKTQQADLLDAQVLRELVGRFAELLPSAAHAAVGKDATSVYSGSDSTRRTSSCGSDYSSSPSEGSIAEMNALQRVKNGLEDPLVAIQHQAEVHLKVHKEAKKSAEEERIESARQQGELRNLASCVHDVSPTRRAFKRNKLKRVLIKTGVSAICHFLKNPFSVSKSHKDHEGYPAARKDVNPVVMPRARSVFYPSEAAAADPAPAQTRSAPRKARSKIQFQTVQSTQRDVEAWTTEEYMTRNARLQGNGRKDDEEFGGIEGNNLMNQYFDDDVRATYDSDSD